MTGRLQIERFEILNDEKKARPDCLSISVVDIYRNNQNMIAIVAVRPNIDNNFSRRNRIADMWTI
jgi:hypothetical protein